MGWTTWVTSMRCPALYLTPPDSEDETKSGDSTVKDLGGWKTEQTMVAVYLQPDEDAQRTALERTTVSTRSNPA
ncbi:MAG: hypothetical protein JWM41_465 [Gemmatimonadetes bacterium]|nr:hypothetical protein [Gemmatimonadota bacterium]